MRPAVWRSSIAHLLGQLGDITTVSPFTYRNMTMEPEVEIVTNADGGKQSYVKPRFELIPPVVLRQIAITLSEGADKYGEDNWKLISISDHINHALNHINLYYLDDKSEDHLNHAACRLLFAYYQHLQQSL